LAVTRVFFNSLVQAGSL